jgi:hypothetical protein
MSTSSSAVPKITSRQLFGINKSARMLDRTTSLKPFLRYLLIVGGVSVEPADGGC